MDSRGDELEIPKACIIRIAKATISSEGTKINIADPAKDTIVKAARLFINYLTAGANEFCLSEGRAILTAQHVLKAVEELEYPFGEELERYLETYRSSKAAGKEEKDDNKSTKPKTSEDGNNSTSAPVSHKRPLSPTKSSSNGKPPAKKQPPSKKPKNTN